MEFEIGQKVGNYRILQRLGAGGMGEVFLAEHPMIGKTVALKVIHPDMSVNREVVARFINEAKAVSKIGNDHIVDVHDFGTTPEGAHFFIMEYLQGQTLAMALGDGSLSMARPNHVANCLHIGAQVASGLAAAHKHNIIHRDLKPDNIMLVEKLGDPLFVKILDFGLAKVLEADAQKLTAMGVVLGTPEFMSPEAAESKGVDARSDVYSFGVLLFFMLCGRLPFLANSMGEMMVQHVCHAPPVPRSFNPQIPPAVEQIILRCLAKKPEDRFQSMGELRAALMAPEQYLSGSPRIVPSDGVVGGAPHPALIRPAESRLKTMNIEPPPGYAQAAGRRVGTLIAIAVLSGGGGVAAALVEGADSTGEIAVVAETTAPPAQTPPQTPPTGSTTAPGTPAPSLATEPERPLDLAISVRINSEPQGAVVADADGQILGTTPFDWHGQRDGNEVSWSFSRDGYGSLTYRFLPSGEEAVSVALVAEKVKTPRKRPREGKRPCGKRTRCGHPGDDNLLMPGF